MRILTIDSDAIRAGGRRPPFCDVQVPLLRLTRSADRGTALRSGKLLELAQALSDDGSTREVHAFISFTKLVLHSRDNLKSFHPTVEKRTDPAAYRDESRRFIAENVSRVEIEADWPDHGRVHDGIPVMHYRIRVKRPHARRSNEIRLQDPEKVREFIYEAFKWDKE
jgi:hypothetical protein